MPVSTLRGAWFLTEFRFGRMRLRVDGFESVRLARVPDAWRGRVQTRYRRKLAKIEQIPGGQGKRTRAEQAANAWLLDVSGLFEKVRFPPGMTDGDIRDKAAECAARAMSLAEIVPGVFVADVAALRARLALFVDTYGAVPPGERVKDAPAVRRMTCPIWWRRALRVAQARQLERGAVLLGYVHKRGEIYASDATVARRMEQRRRNAAMLEATAATNLDTGDEYTLAELAAVSVANPAIRRGELMTRIAGFELVAKGLGHVAEFVTLTCPSRFHRMRQAENGRMVHNKKHDGSTPREAQQYLVRVWGLIRAKLARMGLRVYGFRIAEPHHDACPHWHVLLFMPPMLDTLRAALPRFRAVFRRYALRADGDETGAKKYRVRFDAIDMQTGSAAGYVLKYVSKNIDGNGYQVQGDIEGRSDAIYPGQRVEAWASTWGIRQFQQIGGPPVGVWRELRRMKAQDDYPAHVNEAIAAADCGKNSGGKTSEHWARFVGLMGGPVVARAALPLRVATTAAGERINTRSGEVTTGKQTLYGEDAPGVTYGVRWMELEQRREGIAVYSAWVQRVAASVRYSWEITRGRNADNGGAVRAMGSAVGGVCGSGGEFQEARGIRREQVSGAAGSVGGVGGAGVGFSGGFLSGAAQPRRTRTRVNNCTRDTQDGPFCMVDFEWMRRLREGEGGDSRGKSGDGGDSGAGRIESPAFQGGARREAGNSGDGGRAGSAGA